MSTMDFDFEFYMEAPDPEDKLRNEAKHRLRELAEGHSDFIGAAVAVEPVARKQSQEALVYEARIIAHIRPAQLVTTEQAKTTVAALKGALDAMERQVREQRAKLHEPWKQPSRPVRS